jgi:hypothetical protein
MSVANIQKMCIDLGNGGFKGAVVRIETLYKSAVLKPDGSVKEKEQPEVRVIDMAYLPSKVGVGDTNLGALSLGGVGRKSIGDKPVQITSADGTYLVGHNVERYAALIERFDAGKYTDSPELRAITRALLAEMIDGGDKDVALIVALPVEVMMSATAKETIRGIESWLLGKHEFGYDHKQASINVVAMKAMAQPVGAFFSWGLNDRGEWSRDESDLTEATVAILDSGFNTLDLLLVKQGRIEKRFTGGDNLGVRVAASEIANALNARYGIKWSLIEVDVLIREYLERGKVHRVFAGQKTDLTPIVRQALNTFATRTVDFVQETWGNAREFSYVLLAGGGAYALNAAIRKHIPHAELLDEPVHANAIGLAKLAQRPNVFKGL